MGGYHGAVLSFLYAIL